MSLMIYSFYEFVNEKFDYTKQGKGNFVKYKPIENLKLRDDYYVFVKTSSAIKKEHISGISSINNILTLKTGFLTYDINLNQCYNGLGVRKIKGYGYYDIISTDKKLLEDFLEEKGTEYLKCCDNNSVNVSDEIYDLIIDFMNNKK